MKKKNKAILTVAGMFTIAILIYMLLNISSIACGINNQCGLSSGCWSFCWTGAGITIPFAAYGEDQGTYSLPSDVSETAAAGVGPTPEEGSGFATVTSQCTNPSYPVYCSNVGLCFAPKVVCSTVKSCGGKYYGCFSGNDKLVCIHGDAYCFDHCIKEDTIAECGGGLWGCWIEGCDDKKWSIPFCYDSEYHCCESAYPVYKPEYDKCWGEGWQCTQDSHCQSDYVCENNMCIEKKQCPATCPEASPWSECYSGIMTRTSYKCGPDTNYQCMAINQEMKCGEACTNLYTEPKLIGSSTTKLMFNYNCGSAPIEEALGSIWPHVVKAWYLDTDTMTWYNYEKGQDWASNLKVLECGMRIGMQLDTTDYLTFVCPEYQQQPECTIAANCESKPHVECVGFWTCADGICVWQCGGNGNGGNGGFQLDLTTWAIIILIVIVVLAMIYYGFIKK